MSKSSGQQKIMTGLWKDLPEKIHHKVSENWISATLLVTPVLGTYWYAQHFQEQEKLEHSNFTAHTEEEEENNDKMGGYCPKRLSQQLIPPSSDVYPN
ncbi:hypothetical protein Bca52824_021170 [Brassica carinata]|uniref:Uncharacterized protein n=1 Tax=Brassica carinata TaxID=52824 RepID=A0A8X7VTV6_BRACI|nr:hypothetical protein Bca52824_021170 [Brassica carinata]